MSTLTRTEHTAARAQERAELDYLIRIYGQRPAKDAVKDDRLPHLVARLQGHGYDRGVA